MKRIDVWLTELKIAPSRAKAQELIFHGLVEVNVGGRWNIVKSSSKKYFHIDAYDVRVKDESLLKYVSRAGLKLEGALHFLNLDIQNMKCLDVGQSTGGFTDCLLQHGASHVVGFDVGHGQLAESLKNNSKVTFFEGLHIKEALSSELMKNFISSFDMVVCDLSFISVTQYMGTLIEFAQKDGHLLFLIKPQFELSKKALNKKGVVTKAEDFALVKEKILHNLKPFLVECVNYFESSIKGQDGNREFFVYVRKK